MPRTLSLRCRKVLSHAVLPDCPHGPGEDAGMDLYAAEDIRLQPGLWKAVRTGIAIQLPSGYEGQIRPRSGLASKHGVTLLNAPGTIDPGYRGEIRVLLVNLGPLPYQVSAGDRIAQLVVAQYASVRWLEVESLDASSRDAGGFGSTGR
ncbi:MAG: dUTP diphosphatase [Bryobacterales bacterium]|nr:dUTP diphosphatase [Bryobacterales bacterium]